MSNSICTFFASGRKCKFGNNCRFLHDSFASIDPLSSGSLGREHHDPLKESASASAQGSPGQASRPTSQFSVHPKQEAKSCFQFLERGWCKFGSKCRFLHQLPVEQLSGPGKQVIREYEGYVSYSLPPTCQRESVQINKPWSHNGSSEQEHFDKWCSKRQQQSAGNVVISPAALNAPPDVVRDRKDRNDGRDNAVHGTQRNVVQKKKRLCKFFKAGHCSMGADCHFWHPADPLELDSQNVQCKVKKNVPTGSRNPVHKSKRLCKFFKAGYCSLGSKCHFLHPQDKVDDKEFISAASSPATRHVKSGEFGFRRQAVTPRPTVTELNIKELSDDTCVKLLQTEVDLLKKRYPQVEEVDKTGGQSWHFTFVPSDPDWPYDVKQIDLVVNFPGEYPKKVMDVSLPVEQTLPETVGQYVKTGANEWLQQRFETNLAAGKAELLFRPFLRWLDKSLERIVTEGLKQYKREMLAEAAGVQFISANELQEEFAAKCQLDEEEAELGDDSETCSITDSEDEADESEEGDSDAESVQHTKSLDPARRGTEVKLINLQLKEQSASLLMTRICIIIQCSRCKNHTELKILEGQTNCVECSKCHADQLVAFRSSLAHQLSSVVGYLDLQDCTAFDLVLVDCHVTVGCLNCSKDMKMEGLSAGVVKDSFCLRCHQKLRVATEGARFQQLQPSVIPDGDMTRVAARKVKKIAKDPAIQLGKPLPDNGTCKHYKKSFRWLRFPCCGKAYPCDLCHDEHETDHDMKYANRMICGFCCREQAYAIEKPCVACDSSMTKKSGSHWEGGKGCRDKIKMSRGDDKKYANSKKTVSRAAAAKDDKKKTTKLRHAAA